MTQPAPHRVAKLRGTGEDPNVNMLSEIEGTTIGGIYEIRPIGQRTFQQSVDSVRDPLHRFDSIGPWIGTGYSLGAAMLMLHARDLPNLRGLVLFGNPFRWGTPMRHGVAGRIGLGDLGIPVIDITVENDPISNLDIRNGARAIAVGVTGRPQGIRPEWADPIPTIDALLNYGPRGRHTAYNVENMPGYTKTYTLVGADHIDRLAGRKP